MTQVTPLRVAARAAGAPIRALPGPGARERPRLPSRFGRRERGARGLRREEVRVEGSSRAEPAFRRVLNDLRAEILADRFPGDTALPTEAEIAARYAVSRQTVRRAFQDLVAEDL